MQTIDIEYINPKKGSKVLDLGCGQGRHCFGAYMYAEVDVFGFDIDIEKIKSFSGEKVYKSINFQNEQ